MRLRDYWRAKAADDVAGASLVWWLFGLLVISESNLGDWWLTWLAYGVAIILARAAKGWTPDAPTS